MTTETNGSAVEESPSEEASAKINPPAKDVPVLHTALTKTAVTVLRRRFEDGSPSVLLFALVATSRDMQGKPLYTFEEVLELRSTLEHIINSVVVSSTNSLNVPQPAKTEADAAPEETKAADPETTEPTAEATEQA